MSDADSGPNFEGLAQATHPRVAGSVGAVVTALINARDGCLGYRSQSLTDSVAI